MYPVTTTPHDRQAHHHIVSKRESSAKVLISPVMDTDNMDLKRVLDPHGADRVEPRTSEVDTRASARTFPQFPLLPAELRALIWTAAIEQRADNPKVVNMFIDGDFRSRAHSSRLTNSNRA